MLTGSVKKILYLMLGGMLLISPCAGAEQAMSSSTSFLDKADQSLDRISRQYPLDLNENVKVKFAGSFRYRLELRDDLNLNNRTYEDDAVNLFRTRLGMTLSITPFVKLFAQAQDAESFASSKLNRSAGFTDKFDLHQLWAEFKSPYSDIPLSVKVGRQKLAYGDQRFVGAFDWSNVARVFDAVKLTYHPYEKFQVDAWFSQVVKVERSQPNQATHNDNFYGIYATYKPFHNHVIDAFVFFRNLNDDSLRGEKSGHVGDMDEWTFGNRLKGAKAGFDYGLEWAIQTGNRADEAILAWALHSGLGYTIPKISWTPRFSFEYNHASGDSNPRDGKIETFDNLYPTNHLHYGYVDLISLKNTDNFKIGFDLKPHTKLKTSVDYYWFFLDSPSSPVFNAGQSAIRPANPAASSTVGQELDLFIKWTVNKRLNFLGGYSHFVAGPWFKDTGAHDDANFTYVQTDVAL